MASSDETKLTPKSAKAQGLLALLATGKDFERGRLWLQDKLWSDRAFEQGSASLRQALTEIRRSFGDDADILVADKTTVALDPQRVRVVRQSNGEFLEGLDIRDPEFSEWLARNRNRGRTDEATPPTVPHLRPRPASTSRRVIFSSEANTMSSEGMMENFFIDCVANSIRETLTVEIYRDNGRIAFQPGDLIVRVNACQVSAKRMALRVAIEEAPDNKLAWNAVQFAAMNGSLPLEDLGFLSVGNRLIEALADNFSLAVNGDPTQRDAMMLGRMAMRHMYSMRPVDLQQADTLLTRAFGLDPRGIFLAWRAQLRMIQTVERHLTDSDASHEEAEALTARAIEMDPSNSMTLAACGYTWLWLRDSPEASGELARRSVEINPANPLGWDTLATAKMMKGDAQMAHNFACRAQKLGAGSPYQFWWDMGRCLTATLTGRAEEALKLAETSAGLSPNFRPPLRFLSAVYASRGDTVRAQRLAQKLTKLEPDFSFDRLANDPDYPVGALHSAGIIDKARVSELDG